MVSSTDTYLSGIISAYEKFKNQAIEEGIKSSTQASHSGSGYSVEFLPSGSYRVLWDNQIGNLYKSEGVIIGIPACSSDESPDDDNDEWFFDNAVNEFEEKFNQWKSDYLENA